MGVVVASSDDEYCDMSDLLKSSCDHCRSGRKDLGPPGLTQGAHMRGPIGLDVPDDDRAIPATYNGICPQCGGEILKATGDQDASWIVRGPKGWQHEECP